MSGAARLDVIDRVFREFLGTHLTLRDRCVYGAAIEGFSVKSTNRPFDLGSVFGVLYLATFRLVGAEPLVVPPTSVKKFASGNAHIPDLIYTVKTRWGFETDNDNVADAVALARFVRAVHVDAYETRAEREAVRAIVAPKPHKPNVRRTTSKNI